MLAPTIAGNRTGFALKKGDETVHNTYAGYTSLIR